MNIYIQLTKEFTRGRLRSIIGSGQAIVLNHLAIMSKDGDWILRQDRETTEYARISEDKLKQLWKEQENKEIPFIGIKPLAEIKKTNREKDYVVIGVLARRMSSPIDQLLYSRSALDIIDLGSGISRFD